MTPLLDAGVAVAKAALLRLWIAEKKRDLIPLEEAMSHMDEVGGRLGRAVGSAIGAAVVIWPRAAPRTPGDGHQAAGADEPVDARTDHPGDTTETECLVAGPAKLVRRDGVPLRGQ